MTTLTKVARRSSASYRQLDYWLRTGAVWIADDVDPGSGNHRRLTDDEADDLVALSAVVERARLAGVVMIHPAIAAAWNGLRAGTGWRVVLDVNGETA